MKDMQFLATTGKATLLLILIVSGYTLRSLAANADAASGPADETSVEQPVTKPDTSTAGAGNQSQTGTQGASKEKNQGDIFKPSEEISEDFAVSFPVDI